jgi:cullin 2
LDIWKHELLDKLKEKLVALLLHHIKRDRHGEVAANQSVVHGVIQSFVQVDEYKVKCPLELYETIFEEPFLRATAEYYKQEASQLKTDSDCSTYMKQVKKFEKFAKI